MKYRFVGDMGLLCEDSRSEPACRGLYFLLQIMFKYCTLLIKDTILICVLKILIKKFGYWVPNILDYLGLWLLVLGTLYFLRLVVNILYMW